MKTKKITLVTLVLSLLTLQYFAQIKQAQNGLSLDPSNSKIVELGGASTSTSQINSAKFLSHRTLFMNGYNLAFTDGGSAHHLTNAIQLGGASYSTPGGKFDIRNNNYHTALLVNTNQDTAITVRGIHVQNCNGSTISNLGIETNVSSTSAPENVGIKATSTKAAWNRAGHFEANYDDANYNHGVYSIAMGGGDSYGGYFKADLAVNNYGIYAEAQSSKGTSWAGFMQGDLNVNGAAFCSSGSWTGSDKRFKKDIKKIENVSEKLNKLNAYSYNFKTEEFKNKNFDKTEQIGFIAQEVQQVFPQLVKEDKQGYLAVNYQGMVPVLLEAIKEQQKNIDELKKQVEELQKQNDLTNNADSKSAITLSNKNTIVLGQNTPNPFAENTVISYDIPQDFAKAQILFTNIEGKTIQVFDIKEKGKGSLNVYANDLSNGLYNYTLQIDGKAIETKKMVKSN